jgi:hypothetical protein
MPSKIATFLVEVYYLCLVFPSTFPCLCVSDVLCLFLKDVKIFLFALLRTSFD